MQIEKLKGKLLDAVERYRVMSFSDVSKLGEKRIFEEEGVPSSSGFYCQIEVAVLDRLVEDGVDVSHVSVVARDEANMLSAELFFCANGRVRWNGAVYRYKDGIPEIVS